jgi:gliding motility-associated peptidyl-prolyl isomerase
LSPFKYIRLCLLLFSISFWNCQKETEARLPIKYSTGTFIKQSTARNKAILEEQETFFKTLMSKKSEISFLESKHGFWYYYHQKDTAHNPKPKKGAIVVFDYELRDTTEHLIYPKDRFLNRQYHVDKENIMVVLREGLKLLRAGEKVTFYTPSQMAYGFHGDQDKIAPNTPLIVTVWVKKVILQPKEITQSPETETTTRDTIDTKPVIDTVLSSENVSPTKETETTLKGKESQTDTIKPAVVVPKPKPRKKIIAVPVSVSPIKVEKESIREVKILDKSLEIKPINHKQKKNENHDNIPN